MSKYEKRLSPSFSAQDYKNEIKIGNDGNEYVSRPDKNNIFRWYIIKNGKNAYDYYMQFPHYYLNKKFIKYDLKETETKLKFVENDLKKYNIYLFKIGWKNIYNFIDFAWDDARKMIIKKYSKEKYVEEKIKGKYVLNTYFYDIFNIIFYTDNSAFFSLNSGKLNFQWNLDKNSKNIVNQTFTKYFKKNYIHPKNIQKSIIVKLRKNK